MNPELLRLSRNVTLVTIGYVDGGRNGMRYQHSNMGSIYQMQRLQGFVYLNSTILDISEQDRCKGYSLGRRRGILPVHRTVLSSMDLYRAVVKNMNGGIGYILNTAIVVQNMMIPSR
mmetsp:Transcript_100372/g.281268  ORF Transcript_100372/g.281268 Transcript_100372/m.281268 type:complete len:117 (-) Transcript_100372:151-501(-)